KISRRSVMMGVETPQGVLASIDQSMAWQAVIILIVFFTFAHYFYHLVVVRLARYVALRWPYVILLFLGGAFTIFTMIRGGYGPATITPSVAYYSSNTALRSEERRVGKECSTRGDRTDEDNNRDRTR